jgi:hypothetical protein
VQREPPKPIQYEPSSCERVERDQGCAPTPVGLGLELSWRPKRSTPYLTP